MLLCKRLLGLFALLLCCAHSGWTTAQDFAVVYPRVERAYQDVFDGLLTGIRHRLGTDQTNSFVLPDQNITPALKGWIQAKNPKGVISLGRQAYDEIRATGYTGPLVSGAIDLSPQTDRTANGISLSISPELFFRQLKSLKPGVDRIHVVYNPAKNQWIINNARKIAGELGFELKTYSASDLQAAAQRYRTLLQDVRPDKDALWIPYDGALIDLQVVLPVIVEQSWYRRLVVFSNSLLHVQHGVLFGLYPDPEKLGRRLAERLQASLTASARILPAIDMMQDVKRALNLRFARHLDIDVRRVSDDFDIFYPAPNP